MGKITDKLSTKIFFVFQQFNFQFALFGKLLQAFGDGQDIFLHRILIDGHARGGKILIEVAHFCCNKIFNPQLKNSEHQHKKKEL